MTLWRPLAKSRLGALFGRRSADPRLPESGSHGAERRYSIRDGNEEHLRGVLDSLVAFVGVLTPQGIVLDANRACFERSGFTPDDVLGRHLADSPWFSHAPEVVRQIRDAVERGRRGEQSHFDMEARLKGGGRIWLDFSLVPTKDCDGRIVRLIATATDISDRKASERAVAESEAQLSLVTDAMPVLIGYVDADQHYRLNNRAYEEWFGLSRDEIRGKHIRDIIGDAAYASVLPYIQSAFAGTPVSFESSVEYKDRNRHVEGRYIPYISDEHRVEGMFFLVADITERKRIEQELLSAHERNSEILESINDAFYAVDHEWRFTYVNRRAEQWLGKQREELLGKSLWELFPEAYDTESYQAHIRAAQERQPVHVEVKSVIVDRWIEMSIFPSKVGLSVYFREIEERKRAEAQLHHLNELLENRVAERTREVAEQLEARRRAESALFHAQKLEAVGQLTGGVAHDFNNLLTVISGNLDFIRNMSEGNDRLRRLAGSAQRAAERGAQLTRQLLAFSRRQTLHPELIRVDGVIRDFSTLMKRAIGEAIELDLRSEPNLWTCEIDPAQLEAALLNAALNARDAMAAGGRIVIATRNVTIDSPLTIENGAMHAGRYVEVSLADTGTGMAPEVARRAFEPFFTTKDPGQGTGLGLSMVYGFVTQSGGHVDIASELGVGTTLRMLFPASDAVIAEEARQPPAPGLADTSGGATILIAEDNTAVLEIMRDTLVADGYRVLVASNGPEALGILGRGEHVDLLLSDVVMPKGLSGFDLANEARRQRSGLRVLLTSGYEGEHLSRLGGAADYDILAKPFKPIEMISRVKELLRR